LVTALLLLGNVFARPGCSLFLPRHKVITIAGISIAPLKVKQDLYRIAQEALHNTVKHAHASKVELRLSRATELITLEVCDDGVGFDPMGSFPGHLGLRSMQERLRNLGGMVKIESSRGQGTCVCAQVPASEDV
jgi:signal transduction histidine kinase